MVEPALQKLDMMIVIPTGGGKSLYFQLSTLLKAGLIIVVWPLIALIQYQIVAISH
ncbi:DEAD/DEAH box helicase [Microcoleus sp. B4-C3]|uniref:DEAD/DEAH box helicase n=1 Tax=Microcoleus sp. B4-C3 TaxID=2818662 RepID=UPI0040409F7C